MLEQKIFTAFYNLPLTIRRKMNEREELRKTQKPRAWHAVFIVFIFALVGGYAEYLYITRTGLELSLKYIAPALIVSGFLGGVLVNVGSGGASSVRRVLLAVVSGISTGILIAVMSLLMDIDGITPLTFLSYTVWRSFITGTLSAVGAALAEFKV
ncbi:MAG: hypothetical protein HZB19_15175 [Chloroflexi bacterium]|nr:hypothetical protein [Chloroflexota bacterium]